MTRFLKSNLLTVVLVLLDAVAFCSIWFSVYWLRGYLARKGVVEQPINPVSSYVVALAVYLPLWIGCAWFHGLYDHQGKTTGLNQVTRLLRTFFAGLIGSFAVAYLFKQWDIGRTVLVGSSILFFAYLYSSRSYLRTIKQARIRRGLDITRVIIIGVGRTARRVMERIQNHSEGAYQLVGFVDPNPRRRPRPINGYPTLGHCSKLSTILDEHPAHEVFLAVPRMPQNEAMNMIADCDKHGVQFKIVSNLFQVITSQVKIDVIDEVPVVHLRNAELPLFQAMLKRLLDIVVATILLVIFAVPMLLIAFLIRLDSPGPALFRQKRVGKGGKLFTMYKFRTMRTDAAAYAVAPTDAEDPRITKLGSTLRRFSFDEFPQLLNVIIGNMSMVGPRPEMPFIVEQYEEWQRRRLDVKPGVTGLWQIVGRKNLPLALNLEYDFYYIKNQSLFFDLVILVKTIPAVIYGRGAF